MHQQLSSSCVYTCHIVDRVLCVGGSLDWAVSLFIQVQQSPCQCHHVFITEGNPAAEPWLSYVRLIIYRRHISGHRSASLTLSLHHFYFTTFFPLPGDCKYVFAAHAERRVMYRHHHPVCFSLRAMAFSGRVVAGDILYNMTGCRSGWQLCRCCYFSVREGRAGALRCPDHVSDTAASGLTLEDSRLCDGLFYVAVWTDLKMYLRLESCKAFKKSLHFDLICRTPICLSECFIPMIMYYPELCICFDELHVRHLPCWELHHVWGKFTARWSSIKVPLIYCN